jgi:Ca2+-binding EF-hand superfamily protein
MVNSISGSSMAGMYRPDPQDFFKKVDSDGSGGISQAELKTLAENLQKINGKALDVGDEAFSTYDSDGDGALSSDELKSLLEKSGFGPPAGGEGMAPPPPPQEQATASYTENTGDDTVSALIKGLQSLIDQLSSESDSEDSNLINGGSAAKAQRPDPKEFFDKVDGDGSGDISQSELASLAGEMKNRTGISIDTSSEAFSAYDVSGDGVLSQDELKGFMDKNRPEPPHGQGEGMRAQTTSNGQTSATAVTLQDQISVLRDLLEKLTSMQSSNNETADSLLSITT